MFRRRPTGAISVFSRCDFERFDEARTQIRRIKNIRQRSNLLCTFDRMHRIEFRRSRRLFLERNLT